MRNFDTSILNAIRDNLRNRYDDGFPILKELIQNADDAEAGRLRFGWHTGFDAGRIDHPLLASPALWFWNDGRIKPGDIEALCSFGINAKAADAGAIGKFGLGMKSVFHLCEAFFFVGWQGNEFRQECLSPWEHRFHPDWDETARDWDELRQFGQACVNESSSGSGHWFLLWLPLRQARQLKKPDGTPTSAIMQRFPGDHPDQDLAFLREADLASRLAEIMPLLHHLSEIEAKGGHEAVSPFKITLLEQERLERVDGDGTARGRVELSNGLPTLGFCGQQRDMAADPRFVGLKERPEWPPVFVLNNATGEEEQKEDKARPEGAVLFARANDGSLLTLRWAVFLPLSDRKSVV